MQYNTGYNETIFSYANNIHTKEGYYELAFKSALTRLINDHARRLGVLKENQDNFLGEDIREGLTGIISIKILNPQFEGQTKTRLGNSGSKRDSRKHFNGWVRGLSGAKSACNEKICEKALQSSRARGCGAKARSLQGAKMRLKLITCRENWPIVLPRILRKASCFWLRAILRAVLPNRAEAGITRQFYPCAVKY